MKKFKLPDPEFFNFKDCVIAGDECVLVTPKMMGVDWTDENKYFRSSIWRKSDMHPVSLGFRKFMNYGEKPSFEPIEEKLTFRAIQKIDGSCLIVSDYKDELIVRTRGTVDATKLDNGFEIELLKKKYPKAFDNEWLECGLYTLLFEWTTPTNRIVLNETAEPTLWLIGMVNHSDYSYIPQHNLDTYAKEMGVERPKSFGIRLGDNIEEFKKSIEPLKDIEGVVIYDEPAGYETNQILKKIKTLRYLELHRVFTGVKSVDHLLNLYIDYGEPNRVEFEKQLSSNFDWELVVTLKPLMDELYEKLKIIVDKIFQFIMFTQHQDFVNLTRKEKAEKILKQYPEYPGIVFAVMDNKKTPTLKLWETLIKK
jgi:hypothetical protein